MVCSWERPSQQTEAAEGEKNTMEEFNSWQGKGGEGALFVFTRSPSLAFALSVSASRSFPFSYSFDLFLSFLTSSPPLSYF